MRVPVSWLRECVPLEMPLPELAEWLSISTAEVEGIERVAQLHYGFPDIRPLWEGDLRVLTQF